MKRYLASTSLETHTRPPPVQQTSMTALTDIRGERSFFRKTRGNAIVKLVRERKSLIQLEQHYLNDIGNRVRSQ